MKKKVVTIIIGLFAVTSGFAQSGQTGPLAWVLENGTLTISGPGAMPNYSTFNDATSPWYAYKESIQTVVIENGVTGIGEFAFYECSNLTSVSLGNTVKSIEWGVFYECSNLSSLVFPESLETIGGKSFRYSGVTSVNIPASVTSIGEHAFLECFSLSGFEVNVNNPVYSSANGVLLNKAKDILICYPIGRQETICTIPNTVKTIEGESFYGCTLLTTVFIPGSVTSIGDLAFAGCSGLTFISASWSNPAEVIYGNSLFSVKVSDVTLIVPAGTTQAYQQVATWKDFTIVESGPLLAGLMVSKGKLSPSFSPSVSSYSVTVPSSIENITLTATPFDESTTVEGAGTKTLNIGENDYDIVVTAPDGTTQQTYTVKVTRFSGDYWLEWNGFADQYTTQPYQVPGTNVVHNISVLSGRYLYYTLVTGDVSGDLSLYFLLDNRAACSRTIAVLANSMYRIILDVSTSYPPMNPPSIIITTEYEYGRPARTTVTPTYYSCVFTVTGNGETMLITETTFPGIISDASIFDVIFEGTITSIGQLRTASFNSFISGDNLHVNTPQAETIELYSITGNRLFRQAKPAGEAIFPIGNIRDKMLIVKGSSGWAKKQVK
jgi:hypothetical protein